MDFVFAEAFAKFAEAVFLPKNWTVSGSCSTEELDSVYFAKSIVVRRRSSISPFSVRRQPPFASRRSVFASSPAPPVRHQTLIGSPADVLRRLRRRQQ